VTLDIQAARNLLQDMDFKNLFNELGWSLPRLVKPLTMVVQNTSYSLQQVAELAGVSVFEVTGPGSSIPDAQMRKVIYKEVSRSFHENLLIFVNAERSQSLWYWVKRDGNKEYPREHLYVKGQPGDLFLGKLGALVFDISDFENNAPGVLDVARRLKNALDVERVTKRFYEDFKSVHDKFINYIEGIDDERDREWYASVLLNRLMFIYFLQRKWFIDNGNQNYLQDKLADSRQRGPDLYYSEFLYLLFFEGFAKPEEERSEEAKRRLGNIRYLNGGLFLLHPIEKRWPNIRIPDIAFEKLLNLFSQYTWNLDDTPGGKDNELSPHVLGYIFEKYINQKFFGAYYTRPEITEYLCERTIHKLILERVNSPAIAGFTRGRHFETIEELLMNLDARLCRDLLDILPKISILDPACGSGAFLVSAMNTLTTVYAAITGKIDYLTDDYLQRWIKEARSKHNSLNYYVKKKIITENLFGVDIMEEATEIAKLRLFLALVSSVRHVDDLEPLPNIDFNILPGNSLIGLVSVDEQRLTQLNLLQRSYHEVVDEKNRLVQSYKNISTYTKDLRALRDDIQAKRESAIATLNELLLDDFKRLGGKFEEATWDSAKRTEGKPIKRALRIEDIQALHPFHWGYEFNVVMERGGFDIIITNPPWEIFKPQAKEFFALHSDLISKNKMRIEEFEQKKAELLQNPEIRAAWLKYQSGFPFQSAFFRNSPQYANQISTVNGKKQGTDINLYKLFTEQCYNLLREGGQCGIVIPSGIYTDLGAKQLRELLFDKTTVTGLFCFENRRLVFEGVDSRFKFVVLTYEKGGQTTSFPAAFMRHDVLELERFPRQGALPFAVNLIRRLSPDSLSVMEFKCELDMQIAQKMLHFPLLGEKLPDTWNVALTREFDMTNDSHLFKTQPAPGRLPLYEGKMIHQFTHQWSVPRYWVDEQEGRRRLLGRKADTGQRLEYQSYRLGFRDIARNTDNRTLISTVIPPAFHGNKLPTVRTMDENGHCLLTDQQQLFLCALWNSFTLDWLIRTRVTTTLNFFYIYQLPIPRLTDQEVVFNMIVERAARLICTTPEFQQLWESVKPGTSWSPSLVAIDRDERAKLRAELDGIIAHLYGLSEDEFAHVLGTFPLVEQSIKDAALAAYQTFALAPDDLAIKAMIEKGENERVEFKVAACWNAKQGKSDSTMRDNIIQEVAAFLNKKDGGAVLIGVEDNGNIVGLVEDYKAANASKANRDGYQLFLLDVLKNSLDGNWSQFYTISFGTVQGKDICRIDVLPATEPVYLKNGDFWVREGNRKRKFSPKETMEYIKQRWG
jgi:hypothetical protein